MKKFWSSFMAMFAVFALAFVPQLSMADEVTATLVHTASASWGSNEQPNTVDGETEYYNTDAGSGWAGTAYAEFNFPISKGATITDAVLTWTTVTGGRANTTRDNNVYYLDPGTVLDYEDILANKNAYQFTGAKTFIQNFTGQNTFDGSIDVTEAIQAILNAGGNTIIFQWTGNAASATLAGKASENAPKLVIKYTPGAPEIVNAAFDVNADEIITVTTQGYARNVTGDQIYGLQPVTGWTAADQTESDPGFTGGVFAYGSENLLNNKVAAPAADPEGNAGVALGLAGVWGGIAQYTQPISLTAGDYKLTYVVYNGANTGAVTKNLFGFITSEGTEYLSTQSTFTLDEWQNVEVAFTLAEDTEGVISVGFIGSGGSGTAPHLFVDNVKLERVPGIEAALANLDKAIEAAQAELAKYDNGDGIFQYTTAELSPLVTAIQGATMAKMAEDATTASINEAIEALNTAVETFAPVQTAPKADQKYKLTLTTTEGTYAINIAAEGGISIAEEGTDVYFVAQEDGSYAISNGTEYVVYEGSNNWTMTASAEPYGWTIAAVEGGYTITGKNGFLGTNTSDGAAAGSPCYGDKKANNGFYIWTIEEVTEPEPEPEYVYVDLTQEMYHVWTGVDDNAEIAEGTPYCLYEVGNSAGNIYGNSNVFANEYADLSEYNVLVITTTEGTPRLLLNRPTDDSQDYINIPNNAEQTAKYLIGEENGVYVYDLAAIKDDYGFVHLNAIKGANWANATVTSIQLGKVEVPEIAEAYEGIVEQSLFAPDGQFMVASVSDQTVKIVRDENGLVAKVTFSGFELPLPGLATFPEFSIENVGVETAEDGLTINYSAANFQVSIPRGQMIVNYNGTLEGEQAGLLATPVFKLTLANGAIDEVYFGADQEAIDAYKEAHKPEPPAAPAFAELSTDGSTAQYLYNVEAKAFYLGANDWGTRASFAADKGYPVMITLNEDGETYTLQDQLPNGNWNSADCQAADQIWVDGANRAGDKMWTVAVAEDGTFTIANNNVAEGGNLSVVPSTGDTRLYLSTAEDAQDVWAAVSEEEYNKYIEAYAEYLAALDEWNKTHYEVGDDIVALAPAAWDGQTGGYSGLGHTSYERYSDSGSIEEGDVLTQTLTDLKNGTYEVTLEVAASYTSGRGFECPTGEGLAAVFANEAEEGIEVIDRTWVSGGEQTVVTLTAIVNEGILKYGIKNLAPAGNWYVANVLSIVYASESTEPAEPEIAINVERYTGLGYGVTKFEPDFTEALEYLGIENITDATVVGINPDGTEEAAPGPGGIDGWCSTEGAFVGWGKDATKICVKFFPSVPQYEICDMNGADEIGATYTVKYGLKANDKMFTYVINVTFVEAPQTTFEIVKTIQVAHKEIAEAAYSEDEPAPTFDVAEVCEALGIDDIAKAESYIVNVTTGDFVLNTTDGWRDANGDAAQWADATNGFCVKLNNPASGEFDYTGAHDNNFQVGDTYVAKWALTYEGKAVVLEVDVTFYDPTAVGNEDNTSTWWTAFSDFFEISKGQTANISFDNYNAGDGANWNNWLLIAQKQDTQVYGAGENEYFALRNDNYGWGGYYNGGSLQNDFNWDAFVADMNGSHVDMTLGMDESGQIVMNSLITTAEGTEYNYSYTSNAVADVDGFEFFFTVELSHIRNLQVEIVGSPVSIAGFKAAKSVKSNGKYLENGKIVIYRNGQKFSVTGAAIK